ncbi:GreA/GreB family elongation factor [Rhodocyclus tenuis]|uniref:GreA/GreB family elongation factor n=1 Tax=Rhodocyclus tenuis TaxID=1066 RepID=UPI001907337A|nr:GreA/GreB family elongation factor [Rhodocyclus tenuis]MBK1680112.1 hypothetical protein [Rhodocyclus tenuis]
MNHRSLNEAADAAHFINSLDRQRLVPLIERACGRGDDAVPRAREVLRRVCQAVVLPPHAVPADLVTMNSTVSLHAVDGSRTCELTLVYPEDSDPDELCCSIFSSVGAAVFGRRVGEEVHIDEAGFAGTRWVIAAIPFQPEAHGWHTM